MEWTAVSKKRRVGQPVKEPKLVSMDSRGKDPCWKFVVELRDYRTEPEILAELHLRYPWVKLGRRNGVSSNAHLTAKVERSRSLLERTSIPQWENMCISSPGIRNQEDLHSDGGPNTHHGKAPSTRRASTGCRTHDALGLGRQTGCSHRHGEGCALREATPGKVQQGLRELPNATVRQCPTAVLQLPEVWPHGQDMLERKPDMQVLCWWPPIQPMQMGQPGHPQVCQLRRGTRNHQQGLFQRLTLVNKSKVAQKKVERPQTPAPPTRNAWTKKFVPTMEDFPQTLSTVEAPPTLKHTVEVSRPQVARPKPVATKEATILADQRRQTPKVPHPVQGKEDSQQCGVALKSQQSNPQEEEIEVITIALDGATALLRRVSTGKRHLIPALRKMIEAALDAINTLSV